MIGAPTFIARSMTLQIFSAYASDSEPPKTVKSWLKTKTEPAVDRPVAGDDAVAEDRCSSRPKSVVAMRDERVELDERPGIEQQVEPLARRQLAARVLLLDPRRLRRRAATRRASASVGRAARRWSTPARPPIGCLCARTAAIDIRRRRTRIVRTDAHPDVSAYPQNSVNNSRCVWITWVPANRPAGVA